MHAPENPPHAPINILNNLDEVNQPLETKIAIGKIVPIPINLFKFFCSCSKTENLPFPNIFCLITDVLLILSCKPLRCFENKTVNNKIIGNKRKINKFSDLYRLYPI